jgi:magnesium chelatase family protein
MVEQLPSYGADASVECVYFVLVGTMWTDYGPNLLVDQPKSVRFVVHNMIMIGPPGAGKTLLARAMPGILPEMSIDEALDVTRIYSVADALRPEMMVRARPFRAPHHTISHAGLVGGGNWPHPGEISLAHRGVLFLDELPEFGSRVLEVMRQPIEDKVVTISRAQGSLTFPANFMLMKAPQSALL